MLTQQLPEVQHYYVLKEKTTIGEVLETAMGFEKTAYEFYSTLKSRVGQSLRGMVDELVEEEQRHYEMFREIRSRDDLQELIQDRIPVPDSDRKFSDYVQQPEVGIYRDDQSLLLYALGREQAAMEQYASLAQETPAGPLRDLFIFLAQEESDHKRELEKRYYALVFGAKG